MPVKSPGLWIVTLLIIIVGAVVLFMVSGVDRERHRAMEGIRVGGAAESVTMALEIQPTVCRVGSLAHLRGSFGAGWPEASLDVAIEELAALSAERWVYPIGNGVADCAGADGQTEVGVDSAGSIVWQVAEVGRTVIELPPTVAPAGVDSVAADGQ